MRACAVVECKNKGVHTFPNDKILKQQWIKSTKVDVNHKFERHPRKYLCICSDHFVLSDFDTRGRLRTLKRTAVPSIFPWTGMSSNTINQTKDKLQDISERPFNPTNASKNCSRSETSIRFVEVFPSFNFEMTGTDTDPLQIKDENDVQAEISSLVLNKDSVEMAPKIESKRKLTAKCNTQATKTTNANSKQTQSKSKKGKSMFSMSKNKHKNKANDFHNG